MRRHREVSGIIVLLCMVAIIFAACAKRAPVTEESFAVSKEAPAAATTTVPAPPPSPAPVEQKAPVQEMAKTEAPAVQTVEVAPQPAPGPVELEDIHFEFDRSDLTSEAREILKRHADWLLKNKDYTVVIEGHCDERGTTEYNLALGQRRAAETMKFLANLGIESSRMRIISYGEERPLDPRHCEEAWAKNRRAHFVVSPKK